MALTFSIRNARDTQADVAFCVRAAAAAGSLWTEDAARSYINDADHIVAIVMATWPEKGVSNARVAMLHCHKPTLTVQHMAIDEARIPDRMDTMGGRLKLLDAVLVHALDNFPGGLARTKKILKLAPDGTLAKVHRYIATIPGVTVVDHGDAYSYSADRAIVRETLASVERQSLYGGA